MVLAAGEIGAGTGGEYAEYLLAARRRFAEGHATTVDELRRVYRRAAAAVRQDVASATPGTLRRGHLVALAARLDLRARELNQQVLDAVQKGIRLSVGAGVSGPERIAGSLLGDAFDAGGVRALFANVNERATVALLARTGRDGLKLSDRVWRIGEHYRNNVRAIIEDAVARGENARVVARKLEQYLQPGVHTALKAETRRRLGVSKDVSMEAMRLAVTEMNNAFREGTVMAVRATPGYLGVYWRLSPTSHVLADVCDDYARHNGTGFWPKGEEPTTPHPWCRCYLTPLVENSAAFKERLKEWLRDPVSQPDLERWYNDTARPFLERPAPGLEGLSGGGGLGSSGGGGSGGIGMAADSGGGAEQRRRRRLEQLRAMSDAEFVAEITAHRASKWRANRIQPHLRSHGEMLSEILGRAVDETALLALTHDIIAAPSAAFTAIDALSGQVEYLFVRHLDRGDAIIVVVTRGGLVRTLYPSHWQRWLRLRADLVEVSDRVRHLGS